MSTIEEWKDALKRKEEELSFVKEELECVSMVSSFVVPSYLEARWKRLGDTKSSFEKSIEFIKTKIAELEGGEEIRALEIGLDELKFDLDNVKSMEVSMRFIGLLPINTGRMDKLRDCISVLEKKIQGLKNRSSATKFQDGADNNKNYTPTFKNKPTQIWGKIWSDIRIMELRGLINKQLDDSKISVKDVEELNDLISKREDGETLFTTSKAIEECLEKGVKLPDSLTKEYNKVAEPNTLMSDYWMSRNIYPYRWSRGCFLTDFCVNMPRVEINYFLKQEV